MLNQFEQFGQNRGAETCSGTVKITASQNPNAPRLRRVGGISKVFVRCIATGILSRNRLSLIAIGGILIIGP